MNGASNHWPALRFAEWKDTAITLHMWTQIVGKIRLTLSPWTNHSWHVTLYVTARGLTTSPIPHGLATFEIRFDFIDHQLRILKSDGAGLTIELKPQSVSQFYEAVMKALRDLELPVTIRTMPNEIENPVPFEQDEGHRSYDGEYANRFWRVLVQSDRVFKEFRSRFCGKCSPVHFFWGSFDLAVTRFSGRPAPPHPGGVPHLPDEITREAYSQEVSSLGFWPGNAAMPTPVFIPTHIRNRPGSQKRKCSQAPLLINRNCASLPCPTMRCAMMGSRIKSCWISRRALTMPLLSLVSGTAPRWRKRSQPCIPLRIIRNLAR